MSSIYIQVCERYDPLTFALRLKAFLDAQSNYSNETINNVVNSHAKNMIWASFERNFNVLLAYKFSRPKTGWDRSRPVFDRSICFFKPVGPWTRPRSRSFPVHQFSGHFRFSSGPVSGFFQF
jgi:hypothetical protein